MNHLAFVLRARFFLAPVLLGLSLLLAAPAPGASQEALDEIFAAWNSTASPGCAVGVDRYLAGVETGRRGAAPSATGTGAALPVGPAPLLRAWGMAELEHGLANTPSTVFEAGSVSKQFTAAAVILLELDGVLSLDDDVRRWIPELPDYAAVYDGRGITLRQMMTHTAGLRDWGSVAAIGGWGRSDRTHTHDHVLEITARQASLNYPPGDAYSYSNTGFNLLAIVVERASGTPFAQFSRDRIFEPLGLAHTQWRDDYRRIVPGRSGAYQWRGGSWVIDRPIEDVHGNGGLLTTVGDLLRWNRVLAAARHGERGDGGPGPAYSALAGTLGGEAFYGRMVEQAVLTDGSTIEYAGGLFVGSFEGRRAVTHTGATSGYRAYLGDFPDDGLSVALLCNTGNANPGQLGGRVARLFLEPRAVVASGAPAPADGAEASGDPAQGTGEARGAAAGWTPPSAAELAPLAGRYESHEAEAVWVLEVEGENLVLVRRPGTRTTLRPTGPDTFQGAGGQLRIHRDASGQVVELGLSEARVWDLRFQRVGTRP
jgi:CubicO group peptidase (beta-lactamase class C family)